MRYPDEAHTQIEVSADEGAALGAPHGGFFPVAMFIERGGVLADVLPWEANLPQMKLAATQTITFAAEAVRNRVAPYSKYIDTEYQVLAAQADAYVLAGRPEAPTGLDMLVQSAEDSNKTISDEADSIRTKRDQYIMLLNVTRSLRRQAATAIEAAPDVASINSARDQYVEQLASL